MRRLAILLLLTLAACAPRVQEMGSAVQTPTLTDDAYVAADGARLPLKHWPANPHTKAVVLALPERQEGIPAHLPVVLVCR